jgi:hypothetical protein
MNESAAAQKPKTPEALVAFGEDLLVRLSAREGYVLERAALFLDADDSDSLKCLVLDYKRLVGQGRRR